MNPTQHKRRGRAATGAARDTIRALAVERVREGERPGEVMASYGFHRCTIYGWLKAERASPSTDALSASQERQLFRLINGKSPARYGFAGSLWTLGTIGELVGQRYATSLPPGALGALLTRLGLLPREPLAEAWRASSQALTHWQRNDYPAIARTARLAQAELCFWNDAGMHLAQVNGTVPTERMRTVRTASAVSPEGSFWFITYAGTLGSRLCIDLLRRLMHRRERPLHLILDAHPAHRSPIVLDYAASLRGRLALHYLPEGGDRHPRVFGME